MIQGKVKRISGPIIRAQGLGGAGLFDVVEVGEKRIVGEIVRLEKEEAVIQVYEDETGLQIGAPAVSTGRPLSVLLGPGLMGTIYDGIQRPLEALYKKNGAFMSPGARGEPLDTSRTWHFTPDPELAAKLAKGEELKAVPGLVLGSVKETESIVCKIMVPPGTRGGEISALSPEGDYT
ncbi:MAG: V-type ATP synthase subunit A, partial [Treponema sp.]|nr:V-type ATP synthase subunit A [Treponema sp.]